MNRRAAIAVSMALGATVATGGVLGASALGAGPPQGPPTGTLEFDFQAGSTSGFNPASGSKPNRPPRAGDLITVRGTISRDGKRIGTASGVLTFEGAEPTFTVVYRFQDGSQLIAEGVTTSSGASPGAIVGGTGIYAGARGETIETVKDMHKQIFHEAVRFIS